MRLVVGIFAWQNRSKTSRPVARATGLNLEAFVLYSDYKERQTNFLLLNHTINHTSKPVYPELDEGLSMTGSVDKEPTLPLRI